MRKIVLNLTGMHCTACSLLIDTVLEELPGVKKSKTSYADQKVEVEFDPSQVTTQQMVSTIQSEGYEASF